jgi:hypothetical protein
MSSVFALIAVLMSQTIYTWTDARGVQHYTDDPTTIPGDAKVSTAVGEELSNITAPKTQQQAAAAPQPVVADDRRDSRSEEDYWRQQFRALKEKVRNLEDEIALDKKKVDDPTRLPMTGNFYCAPQIFGRFGSSVAVSGTAVAPLGTAGNLTVTGGFGQSFGFGTPLSYPYGSCWYQPNSELAQTADRLERNRASLKRAKEDLSDLERRAANAAVPLEWRR